MSTTLTQKIFLDIGKALDVPDSAYEAAKRRYEDVGQWLNDPKKSRCSGFSPAVSPQGSFRLGTVIAPPPGEDYDLDLMALLRVGISQRSHTQQQLKELLRADLEAYRLERSIQQALEEKRRCWRLNYKDQLGFHLDAVPAIPLDPSSRLSLQVGITRALGDAALATTVAQHSTNITDRRHPDFTRLSNNWLISNQEGYALWFQARMQLARQLLTERATGMMVASVDQLPAYQWKSPLQRCVQMLKRHRDLMFTNARSAQPISVIITTLAAHAYTGQVDIIDTIGTVLHDMGSFVRSALPRVPNPVNPAEDFADKWSTPEGLKLDLEGNFWRWYAQAQADFEVLSDPSRRAAVRDVAKKRLGVTVDLPEVTSPAPQIIAVPAQAVSRPWYAT